MRKILIEGMSGNLGGVETFVHNLYLVLKDKCQVDFITVDPKIPFQDEFESNGSKIHVITPRYKSVSQFKKDIYNVFKKNDYDVFWFNRTTLSSIDTIRLAKKNGVGTVICHSHQSKNMGSAFTAVMHNINRKKVSKYVDYKAACSNVAAEYFFGNNISDVKIFPNAVNVSKYEPDSNRRKEAREKLGLKDELVIGHVGRFAREKNHKQLIDIFDNLSKSTNSYLLLCGVGELMEDAKRQVEEKGIESKVSFLGMRKDIPDIFQAMDVMILPSLFEGLPFVLVEAQASGVPCVVSDTVSPEAKLTDIIDYVPLDAKEDVWKDAILKYKNYEKVSKRDMLNEKGFTFESFEKEVEKIVKPEC